MGGALSGIEIESPAVGMKDKLQMPKKFLRQNQRDFEEEEVRAHFQTSSKIVIWLGWLSRWMMRPLGEVQAQKEEQVGRGR